MARWGSGSTPGKGSHELNSALGPSKRPDGYRFTLDWCFSRYGSVAWTPQKEIVARMLTLVTLAVVIDFGLIALARH